MEKKKIFALLRIGVALIAAVVLLAASGWAAAELLGKPASVAQGAELSEGDYVTAEIRYIMDICGAERKQATGEIVSYYAIAPVGDQFVILRFPARAHDEITELETDTLAYLRGESTRFPFLMNVTGMVRPLAEPVAALLSGWLSENEEWMVRSGMIAQVEDYDTYLCGYMIDTETTGAVKTEAAAAMTVLAGVLVVYALAEAVVLCLPKRAKPRKDPREDADV